LCQKILEGLDYEVAGFCRLCKNKPTKENGYVQVSWGGANKFCVLGELLSWAGGVIKDPGAHYSHLCCQPLCIVPGHIVVETPQENNLRKGCPVWVDCPHGCVKKIFVCQHKPPCIKYASGYNLWPAFLKNGIH
jgi:hypothetical protein